MTKLAIAALSLFALASAAQAGGYHYTQGYYRSNGTWVNGSRIHAGQYHALKHGDVIQIGTVQLKLQLV